MQFTGDTAHRPLVVGLVIAAACALTACGAGETACPALPFPPILAAAAGDNPCIPKQGETPKDREVRQLRVVKVYERSREPAAGKYPLRCGSASNGYLHMLDKVQRGDKNHGDPLNDSAFEAEMAHALDSGKPNVQGNMLALDVKYNPLDSSCHGNAWGFRVVVGTNPPPVPLGTKPDGLPIGIITAYRLTSKPGP